MLRGTLSAESENWLRLTIFHGAGRNGEERR